MSKNILLCYYTIGGTSYYHDFAEEFQINGNTVLHWNLYRANYVDNKKKILDKILDFKPDLIFSYNNICPEDVVKSVSVPVLILDADNPEFMQNKDIINKYDNLFYLGYQSNSKSLYEKILGAKIGDQNYLFFPTATNFKNDLSITPKINISFIGSNFYKNFFENKIVKKEDRDAMLLLSKEIRKNYYFQDSGFDESLINYTKYYLAGQDRLKYLTVLSDLGLEIYSNSDWRDLFTYDFELANCFKDRVVVTKKENQDIYNSSKVSINLSHPQAVNSFSWRVPDIMASNSCLLMEDKLDWNMIFGDKISDFVKKSIIYRNQYDMREKCIKLLNDEDLRLRCVDECQKAIEANGRWDVRIKSLEKFLGIKLLGNLRNNPLPNSDITNVDFVKIDKESMDESLYKEYKDTSEIEDITNENQIILEKIQNKAVKSDLNLFLRCFVLALYFIPLIGKIVIPRKRIKKIIIRLSEKLNQDL